MPESLWNFAYGSNMSAKKMRSRAGIQSLESCPGSLQHWRLTFHHRGVAWLEPSFASIVPEHGHEVHGVLHRLTPQQWLALQVSEGVTSANHGYQPIPITVTNYRQQQVQAWAFISKPAQIRPTVPCSTRYRNLLIRGAQEHGIHSEYINFLQQFPTNQTDFTRKSLAFGLLALGLAPVLPLYLLTRPWPHRQTWFFRHLVRMENVMWAMHQQLDQPPTYQKEPIFQIRKTETLP
jgi:hypothetical protein